MNRRTLLKTIASLASIPFVGKAASILGVAGDSQSRKYIFKVYGLGPQDRVAVIDKHSGEVLANKMAEAAEEEFPVVYSSESNIIVRVRDGRERVFECNTSVYNSDQSTIITIPPPTLTSVWQESLR